MLCRLSQAKRVVQVRERERERESERERERESFGRTLRGSSDRNWQGKSCPWETPHICERDRSNDEAWSPTVEQRSTKLAVDVLVHSGNRKSSGNDACFGSSPKIPHLRQKTPLQTALLKECPGLPNQTSTRDGYKASTVRRSRGSNIRLGINCPGIPSHSGDSPGLCVESSVGEGLVGS